MLITQARDRAAQMAKVDDLLRQASPDWDAVTSTVGRINDTVTSTTPTEQGRIEPYLERTLSDGMLRLWPAVTARDRKAARLAAEAVRQTLADIADAAERAGPRDPKHTASWIAEVVGELDDAAVRSLLGVSYRTWRRWLAADGTTPAGGDAARLAAVAAALDHLRRSFTPAGAVAWFARPHPQDGHHPACSPTSPNISASSTSRPVRESAWRHDRLPAVERRHAVPTGPLTTIWPVLRRRGPRRQRLVPAPSRTLGRTDAVGGRR